MPQFRKDPIRNEWVILATERAKRPESFVNEEKEDTKSAENCPFCEGHESETPKEVLTYDGQNRKPDTKGWEVRVFQNKFPALAEGTVLNKHKEDIYDVANAVGNHEIIVTGDHNKPPALFSSEEMEMMLRAYEERFAHYCQSDFIKYVLIIYNHGKSAGASLDHPHSQLFAIPIVSSYLQKELHGAQNFYDGSGKCVFCHIIENEVDKAKGKRIVFENEKFIALAPYASRNPFETWILPKNHNPFFQIMEYSDRLQLAECLQTVLKKFYVGLKNPSFNYYIQSAPCDGENYNYYHWHLEILPRLQTRAGFEYGTGIIINEVDPDEAAKFLREVKTD